MTNNVVSAAKMLRLLELIKVLCINRLTVRQIMERFDIGKRTVYRYITLLEFMEVVVEKDFNNKFFIVDGGCPLCGKLNKRSTTKS